jgi:hypothetical protein
MSAHCEDPRDEDFRKYDYHDGIAIAASVRRRAHRVQRGQEPEAGILSRIGLNWEIDMKFSRLAAVLILSTCGWFAPTQAAEQANPFSNFFGEWTLKNDDWSQNWGNGDEKIKISNHHTVTKPINTANSVLSVVDTPPAGHILWAYNPANKEVRHLSSFGERRIGVGQGTVSDKGDLRLKVSFTDEAPGTYRIYTYTWITPNEYELKSTQYDAKNKATGLFYGGTFVRIKAP